MRDNIYTLLSSFGYPVFLNGTVNNNDVYPDSFFTFWNDINTDDSFYDNDATRAILDYDIVFISKNPSLVQTVAEAARQMLKNNGFVVSGKPTDATVDRPPYTAAEFYAKEIEKYNETE
jgi:hypothetical protein